MGRPPGLPRHAGQGTVELAKATVSMRLHKLNQHPGGMAQDIRLYAAKPGLAMASRASGARGQYSSGRGLVCPALASSQSLLSHTQHDSQECWSTNVRSRSMPLTCLWPTMQPLAGSAIRWVPAFGPKTRCAAPKRATRSLHSWYRPMTKLSRTLPCGAPAPAPLRAAMPLPSRSSLSAPALSHVRTRLHPKNASCHGMVSGTQHQHPVPEATCKQPKEKRSELLTHVQGLDSALRHPPETRAAHLARFCSCSRAGRRRPSVGRQTAPSARRARAARAAQQRLRAGARAAAARPAPGTPATGAPPCRRLGGAAGLTAVANVLVDTLMLQYSASRAEGQYGVSCSMHQSDECRRKQRIHPLFHKYQCASVFGLLRTKLNFLLSTLAERQVAGATSTTRLEHKIMQDVCEGYAAFQQRAQHRCSNKHKIFGLCHNP